MATFRGASADAVVALISELEGVGQDRAAAVADDLYTVAQTLRTEGSLRRFLTDVSVPAEAKKGLVNELFGGKVGADTVPLVASAVGRRWTMASDLANALEHLSVVGHVRSAGADAGRLSDELFTVTQMVKEHPELRDALADSTRSVEDRAGLIGSLLHGRALPATIALTRQSLGGSYRTVASALEAYQKVAASVHEQGVATVRVAKPLSDAEVRRLGDALARKYGRQVHLNLLVDPTVLGGIRVEIGDDVIDGTISSRLDDARRRIAG